MSFPAQVFRILIASPSDVIEERELAVRTIQEWNDLNAHERQLVLLPLRWETHTAPEYGLRPQEVINRQVVDYCDLLVGIFWTRVGTPTGASDSGTIEEIERVANDGKPVMLYFSQSKKDPDSLDIDQLAKLREFKKKTFPKALIENYSGAIEFKDKFSKQIEIQLRSLLASRTTSELEGIPSRPITDIVLHFADPDNGKDLGTDLTLKTSFIDINDLDEIPDFTMLKSQSKAPAPGLINSDASDLLLLKSLEPTVNKDYLRQMVTQFVLQSFFKPVRFWLKNKGGVGARDVYLDISVDVDGGQNKVTFISKGTIPTSTPSKTTGAYNYTFLGSTPHAIKPDEILAQEGRGWTTQIEVTALQPQRELSPPIEFMIGAKESCDVVIQARIFADTLSAPVVQKVKLRLEVTKVSVSADELLHQVILPSEWTI